MDTRDDGGFAFAHGGNDLEDSQAGMTLRDWFAGQALAGNMAGMKADMKANLWDYEAERYYLDRQALRLYRIADAMIAARNGGGE